MSFDPQVQHTEPLQVLATETGAHLMIGCALKTDNEAMLLTPDGAFPGPFGKDHPVAWAGKTSITHRLYATLCRHMQ